MDAGVNGIIIPNIKSFNETKKIIDNCYLPPKGQRGVGFSELINLKKFEIISKGPSTNYSDDRKYRGC